MRRKRRRGAGRDHDDSQPAATADDVNDGAGDADTAVTRLEGELTVTAGAEGGGGMRIACCAAAAAGGGVGRRRVHVAPGRSRKPSGEGRMTGAAASDGDETAGSDMTAERAVAADDSIRCPQLEAASADSGVNHTDTRAALCALVTSVCVFQCAALVARCGSSLQLPRHRVQRAQVTPIRLPLFYIWSFFIVGRASESRATHHSRLLSLVRHPVTPQQHDDAAHITHA